jgi:peroxiredoxin
MKLLENNVIISDLKISKSIYLLIVSCFFSLTLISQTPDSTGYILKVGDIAPGFEFEYTDGSHAKLSDYQGKVIMLQFTASWCKVCREEMPLIEQNIWQVYNDKGLVLIGIDRDEPREDVISFANTMKITYPLALDPGADIFGLYAVKQSGVTRNVIIDRSGRIVMLTRLFKEDEFNRMVQTIDGLIKTP